MKKILSIAVVALVFISSCAPSIYKAPNLAVVVKKHKTIAILPSSVNMTLRPNQAKKLSGKEIENLAQKTGYDIQEQMYGWFLRKGVKYHYKINIQDINTTNDKLKKANISYNDLKSTDRAELAKQLGVDAVIDSRVIMEKPMSDGAVIALGLLTGMYGATNSVQTTLNIYDASSGTLLWKYDYRASGSTGSSPTMLVDAIMRNAAKRIPYRS